MIMSQIFAVIIKLRGQIFLIIRSLLRWFTKPKATELLLIFSELIESKSFLFEPLSFVLGELFILNFTNNLVIL